MLTVKREEMRKAADRTVCVAIIWASIKRAAITNEKADYILPACSIMDDSLRSSPS